MDVALSLLFLICSEVSVLITTISVLKYEAFLHQNIYCKFLGFIICSFIFYELRFYLYIGITLSLSILYHRIFPCARRNIV